MKNALRDQILEYIETKETPALLFGNDYDGLHIKANQNVWLFPGKTKFIFTGLYLLIPDNCIGLIIQSKYLTDKIHVATQIIDDDVKGHHITISITNRSLLPIKLTTEHIIADLTILPKIECHVINAKEQS